MISVLYVDDEPDLLEMGKLHLELQGGFRIGTAESAQAALDMLRAARFDAVVSDYQMPVMDGIALLKKVRGWYGSLPFILFTGRGREEVVVEALNSGADFYLQKGGDPTALFAELAHKIRLAVSKRRAEQALLESETRFRDLTENSLDTIMLFDRDLRHVYVNPNAEKQTGIPAGQFIGKTHAELGFPPDLCTLWERTLHDVFTSGTNRRIEFRIPSGIWIDWLLVPIHTPDGSVAQVITSARDISDRKRAEDELRAASEQIQASEEELRSSYDELARSEGKIRESEALFRGLFDQAFQLAGVLDLQGNVLRINNAALSLTGSAEGEILNRPFWETPWWTHDPDAQKRVKDTVARAVRGETCRFETTHRDSRGDLHYIDFSLKPLTDETGSVIALLPEGRDITVIKRAEQEVQQSRDKFRAFIDHSYDAVFTHDPDGRILDVNATMLEMYRTTRDEALAYTIADFTGPDSRIEDAQEHWKQVLAGNDQFFPWQARRPGDGSLFDVEVYLTRIEIGDKPIILANVRDITERRRAEEAMQKSRDQFRSVMDSLDALMYVSDMDTYELLFINDYGRELWGDITGQTCWKSLQAGQTGPCPFCTNNRLLDTQGRPAGVLVWEFQNTITRRWYECRDRAIPWPDGRIVRLEIATDITERKHAVEALQKSEQQLRTIADTVPGVLYQFYARPSGEMGVYFVSGRAEEIFGISSDDPRGFFARFTECVVPEERGTFLRSIEEVVKTAGKWDFRGRFIRPGGEEIYFHGLSVPVRSGNELVFSGVLLDITAQERAERSLLASESRYHSLFENAADAIFILENEKITDCNPASLRIFRSTRGQIIGRTPYDLSPPEQPGGTSSREQALVRISDALAGKTQLFPWAHVNSDGTEFTTEVTLNRFGQAGKSGLMAIIRDTSERTKALEDLRKSEEKYRSLLETTGTGYVILDMRGRVITANQEYLRLCGRSALEEIQGRPVTDWTAPHDLDRNAKEVQNCIRTGKARGLEIDYQKPDGSIQPIEINASVITSGSEPIILTLCRDISERRNAEKALKKEQEFTRLLLDTSPAFFVAIGADGRTITMNHALQEALEYSPDEIRGADYLTTFVPKEDRALLSDVFRQIVHGGEATVNENRIISKSGKIILVEWHGRPVKHEDSNLDFFVGVGIDITARKKTEARLRESEEKYRVIIENMQDMFYRADNQGNLIMVSPSAAQFAGYSSPEEMMGINIRSFYQNPDDRDQFLAELGKTGSVTGYLVPFRRKDGRILSVAVSSHYCYDAAGNVSGVEGVLHDVTALREAGRAIREANKKLNLLNSITRHDMLNQMMMLKGFLELMRAQPQGPDGAGFLEKAIRITGILERQINFTRDYQDMGVKAPAWQEIGTLVCQHGATLPVGNVRIVNDCAAVEVYADPLLEKVFYNLIDNALKYGGEILTLVRFSCRETDRGLVIVCEDDGEGIAPGDKAHLFTQGYGRNTGLGLFLSREILAITGITITETGEPGRGARFEMVVPKGSWRKAGEGE